jgi:DNA processing protein
VGALKYWIWLTNLGKVPGIHAYSLLQYFGTPEAAYAADNKAYEQVPGLSAIVREGLRDKSLTRAEQILADCARLNLRILTISDTEYPERLRQMSAPPCVLYVKGHLPQLDDELTIAMVGARNATPYGEMAARRLGIDLARQGAVVVSGAAQGIDSAALNGALLGGGIVVSVLGNGIDVVYPRGSKSLYEDIAASGVLLSEYPPGTQPQGSHFPVRNRIISGLSLGVLVIEGLERSGSLITARLALEQNRDVFAVPGNWNAPMSRGPNLLIQKGEAKLILDAWDILEEYRYSYPHKIHKRMPVFEVEREEVSEPKAPQLNTSDAASAAVVIDLKAEPNAVTDDERAILLTLSGAEFTAEEIIERTEIPARRVMSALTMLQLRALIHEEVGKRFKTSVIFTETED